MISEYKKQAEPFLKWAGGKRWLVPYLNNFFPKNYGRYIEPFLGGGAVYFSTRSRAATLGDVNGELVTTYQAIRTNHGKVWRYLREHARNHSEAYYYAVRDNQPKSVFTIAARFLYLNRTCWNGLYRVNQDGYFNVPKGTKTTVLLPGDEPALLAKKLAKVELVWSDFEMLIDSAVEGDLVFADPPYTVKHNFNGFIKYNESIFTWDDQVRLMRASRRARRRGAHVIISNADHPSVHELYSREFQMYRVNRQSVLAGDANFRALTSELIIHGAPAA